MRLLSRLPAMDAAPLPDRSAPGLRPEHQSGWRHAGRPTSAPTPGRAGRPRLSHQVRAARVLGLRHARPDVRRLTLGRERAVERRGSISTLVSTEALTWARAGTGREHRRDRRRGVADLASRFQFIPLSLRWRGWTDQEWKQPSAGTVFQPGSLHTGGDPGHLANSQSTAYFLQK